MTPAVLGAQRDARFEELLERLVSERFASRLFAKDATIWGPAASAEAAVRLGWTNFEAEALSIISEAVALRSSLAAVGITNIVLCGMGGSSLAPMVIAPNLRVLDSTHPDAVREALSADLQHTAVVVSSKSGTTIETLSHRAAFEHAFAAQGIDPAERIIVITDPGSELELLADSSGMRCFNADPHTGGRFSALTAFGLVPSVLAGADGQRLVRDAAMARPQLSEDSAENPALILAAVIAAGLPQQFVLELHGDASLSETFGMWIEQLIAESTGKDGKGILPISYPPGREGAASYTTAAERVHLTADLAQPDEGFAVSGTLGEQFLLWEVATAALGLLLGVDPFTQPDVESAKRAARQMIGTEDIRTELSPSPTEALQQLRSTINSDGYLAIQAYVNSSSPTVNELIEELRSKLEQKLRVPVALGMGPRYLHSTGQIHKGGPSVGSFLQLIDAGAEDQAIPGSDSTFGELMLAQAQGDATVLRERGRHVCTVRSGRLTEYIQTLLNDL
ncbi:glucose-6-phosphate isomerase [Leucobacter denitrificans]|uniref:Glucose-6-phosphate isomerase n=1 Tax=Leucobacter denitrificans TaxID=683042 RepID=A0A7G9S5T6_9MICO|nr:glucose-6-phosphate isomerase [Leucobacter denitrificans]QNN63211.1 glucose-6-phosphate isomerase [Leucobacter denitrificans]